MNPTLTTGNGIPNSAQTGSQAFASSIGSLSNTLSSPTVVTDANTRESTIPNAIATADKNLGTVNPALPLAKNAGDNSGTTTPQNNSSSNYQDIYNSVFSDVSKQPVDTATSTILNSLKEMQSKSDVLTASQLDAIHAGFVQRQDQLKRTQEATSGQLGDLLMSSGAYRTGSASQVVSGKEVADIQALTDLSNQETAAKAQIYKAKQDFDFELMDKANGLLKDVQDRKYKMASDIANSIVQKNKDDRQYNLDVEKFNHTTQQDKVENEREAKKVEQGKYEFRDLKDDMGNTIGTQIFDKSTGRPISNISSPGSGTVAPGSNGALNPVGLTSDGKVDIAAQTQFLNTLPPPIRSLVQGLIDYTAKPPANTKSGQKLNAYAHMADPTYDEGQYLTRQKIKNDYTSGATAKNIQSLNTSVNHLYDLSRNFSNLPNTDITKFNTIKDWYDANIGKGDVTKVITDLNAVTGELAKVFKGTGATDEEIKNIKGGISLSSSPAQFKAFIEEATSLLGGRVDALNGSYETAMGQPFPRNFINPDTQKKLSDLKNNGYDININGINYTDPNSYFNAHPENVTKFHDAATRLHELFPDRKFSPDEIIQAAESI